MAIRRHLVNAPIREAVIDIQVSPAIPLQSIQKVADQLSGQFARVSKLWQAVLGLEVDGIAGSISTGKGSLGPSQIGVRLDSAESPYVLQLRTNGFTLSRLPPYESWERMVAAAEEFWRTYVAATKPSKVVRLATRYINAINLPLPLRDFSDYLVVAPNLPTALPQTLSSFLQRYVIVDADPTRVAVVTQALEEPQAGIKPQAITILLDIDAFVPVHIEPASQEVWKTLETLRSFKNDVFFEYLTDEALELFK